MAAYFLFFLFFFVVLKKVFAWKYQIGGNFKVKSTVYFYPDLSLFSHLCLAMVCDGEFGLATFISKRAKVYIHKWKLWREKKSALRMEKEILIMRESVKGYDIYHQHNGTKQKHNCQHLPLANRQNKRLPLVNEVYIFASYFIMILPLWKFSAEFSSQHYKGLHVCHVAMLQAGKDRNVSAL